jgi:hypothetical protein
VLKVAFRAVKLHLVSAENNQHKRPLKVKLAKAQIYTKVSSIPRVRFEDQELTSFAGMVVFQKLFAKLHLKERLRACCAHFAGKHLYHPGVIVQWLIVHLLLGFRQLRDVEFYEDDPLICRMLGLKVLPDVSTVTRILVDFDEEAIQAQHALNRDLVLTRLARQGLRRVTLDFDGSVLSTKKHAEGTAVGFNKEKKGARSYYPLYCTVAQTGQILDVMPRSGNVHDSNGAIGFVRACVEHVRQRLPGVLIELRMDSAFFSDAMVQALDELRAEFTISVPFERFAELKQLVVERKVWWPATANGEVAFFQKVWKPKAWRRKFRFLFICRQTRVQQKGPLQLDLFAPQEAGCEFKVVVTNKTAWALKVVRFHEGRGQQEKVFGELKDQANMDYLPSRTWAANKVYLLCAILAHNLGRELQMDVSEPAQGTTEKRSPLWIFEGLEMLRRKFLQRAGRLTRTNGVSTLTLSTNPAVEQMLTQYLNA